MAVFDNGQVAEYGTHESLYAQGGIYTEMFDKQSQFYRENPTDKDVSTNSILNMNYYYKGLITLLYKRGGG